MLHNREYLEHTKQLKDYNPEYIFKSSWPLEKDREPNRKNGRCYNMWVTTKMDLRKDTQMARKPKESTVLVTREMLIHKKP